MKINQVTAYPATLPLLPLYAWNTVIAGKEAGKRPLHNNWTKRNYKRARVVQHANEGGNVGVQIPADIVVLDIDPRNGGDESFAQIIEKYGLSVEEKTWPKVVTGSGGRHYYLKKPPHINVVDTIKGYPGVEFKSKGRQVVAAGSKHPNGKHYIHDPNSPGFDEIPDIPIVLLNMCKRPVRVQTQMEGGLYSPDQIAAILSRIPVEDYDTNDKWFAFMASLHHASNGDARYEFKEWCETDPKYAGDETILSRWDSLAFSNDKILITYKTLENTMRKYGLHEMLVAPRVPKDEFPRDFDLDIDAFTSNLSFEGLPHIHYDETDLARVLDEAEAHIIASGAPIYQSGGRLVQPIRQSEFFDDEGFVRRSLDAVVIMDINAHRLREHTLEHCKFYKERQNRQGQTERIPHAPQLPFAVHILSRRDKWTFPELNGVVRCPTLRPDGSLLFTPGYDEASGLLYINDGTEFPSIPQSPTKADAFEALKLLHSVIKDFPFVGGYKGASYSVALSMMISPIVVRSLASTPGHGVTAPTMGTGKTLLADVSAIAATGTPATAVSQGANEVEDAKRLFSLLLKNDGYILVDNITRPVDGASMATVITQPKWQDRILGESRSVEVSTTVFIAFTGNNLVFQGDMRTRALMCRLDANLERPEQRMFEGDLRAITLQMRPQLVSSALTILRAFIEAGQPGLDRLPPFGRFEQWSDWVRGALVWLGLTDPCESRVLIESDDPDRNDLVQLLCGLHKAYQFEPPFTAAKILELCSDESDSRSDLLHNVLNSVFPKGVSAKQLGLYLQRNQGKIADGLQLSGSYNKHTKVWNYEIVEKRG